MFSLIPVLGALDPASLWRSLPGNTAQGLVWAVMAIGVFVTFKILDFADLTVDGTFATGGAIAAMLILSGCPPVIAVIFAFLGGMLAGLVTGVLHTLLGIPAILSGILSQIALYSVNMHIMQGRANQSISVDKFDLVISLRHIMPTIVTMLIIIAVIVVVLYWYFGTEQGFTIRATGCNENMARAQGISTNLAKILGLVLSNGLVGFAGGLCAQYQGNSDVNMGRGAIVIGLASVIIGEVLGEAVFGKKLNFVGRLIFVALGSIIYYWVIGFVLWFGLPSSDLKLFSAIVVAIFLAVPYLQAKARNSYRRSSRGGNQNVRD